MKKEKIKINESTRHSHRSSGKPPKNRITVKDRTNWHVTWAPVGKVFFKLDDGLNCQIAGCD